MEDAVHAIHGAAHADIKHLVFAAGVFPGCRTGFEKLTTVATEKQVMLATGQVVRVLTGNVGMLPITNYEYRELTTLDNLFGIVVVTTFFSDIEMGDISGGIAVRQ